MGQVMKPTYPRCNVQKHRSVPILQWHLPPQYSLTWKSPYIYLRETKTVIPPRDDEDDDGKCLPPVFIGPDVWSS